MSTAVNNNDYNHDIEVFKCIIYTYSCFPLERAVGTDTQSLIVGELLLLCTELELVQLLGVRDLVGLVVGFVPVCEYHFTQILSRI